MIHARTLLLAAGCTVAGALGGGGIAALATDRDGGGHHGFSGLHRAVHAELVVSRRDDTFAKVTYSAGKVVSVEGDKLTVREGVRGNAYDVVTFTIPDDAKVQRYTGDRDDDSLSDLRAGDKVAVWQSNRKTVVLAKADRDF